jgi:hypothetical protein
MSRSIFDPTGGNPERSGTRFTPPDADQISQLPEQFTNPRSSVATGDVGFKLPPEPPAIELAMENDGKLVVVKLTGKVQKEDYRHFVPPVDEAVSRHGKIRMLVEMHHFHGWSAGALWEDFKFDLRHFNRIERLAIVGDKKWEHGMAIFCKPFTTATIRYFPEEQATEAHAWISAE